MHKVCYERRLLLTVCCVMFGLSFFVLQDVLCGRGGRTNSHPGNEWYRRLVKSNRPLYRSCPKHTKLLVSKAVVQAVHEQDPPGRFLESSGRETGTWKVVSYKRSVDKASQALREKDRDDGGTIYGSRSTTNSLKKPPPPPPVQSFAAVGGNPASHGDASIRGITKIALRNSGLSPRGRSPSTKTTPPQTAGDASKKRKPNGTVGPAATASSWWGVQTAKRQRQENATSLGGNDDDDAPLPATSLENRQSSIFRFFSSAGNMFGSKKSSNNYSNAEPMETLSSYDTNNVINGNHQPMMTMMNNPSGGGGGMNGGSNNNLNQGAASMSSAARAAQHFDEEQRQGRSSFVYESSLQQQQQQQRMRMMNSADFVSSGSDPLTSQNTDSADAALLLESQMRTAELRSREMFTNNGGNNMTNFASAQMMPGSGSAGGSLQQQPQFYSYAQSQQQQPEQNQKPAAQVQQEGEEEKPPSPSNPLSAQMSDWLSSFWPLGKDKRQTSDEQAAQAPKLEPGLSSAFINLARSPSRFLTSLKTGVSSLFDSSGASEENAERAFSASAPVPPPQQQQSSVLPDQMDNVPAPVLGTASSASARRDSLLDDYEETEMESRLRTVTTSRSGSTPVVPGPHRPPL